MKPTFKLLSAVLHHLAEVAEAFHGDEALRLQDDLGFHVLHCVQRMAIAVDARGLDLFAYPAVLDRDLAEPAGFAGFPVCCFLVLLLSFLSSLDTA